MLRRLFSLLSWLAILAVCLKVILVSEPALAEKIDYYVLRYLHVSEPVSLPVDDRGNTSQFSPADISRGKELFQDNCMSCHVGGSTLPDPIVSLSLTALQGANPPRDNINNLVAYFRHPMVYDGSSESYWCREIPESWMSQEQVAQLAAFILTAADKAPGWGTDQF